MPGHTCLGPQTPHGGSVSPDSWASMGSNCDLSGSWEPSLLSPILDICVSPHAQLAKAGLCPPSHFSPVLYLLWLSSTRAEYEGHTGPLRTNKASFLEFSSMTKQLRKDQHVSRHLLYIWVNWGMSVEPRLHTPFGSSDCKPTTPRSTLLQLPPRLTVPGTHCPQLQVDCQGCRAPPFPGWAEGQAGSISAKVDSGGLGLCRSHQ